MARRHSILLIRFKSMGDVVFTLPAVHAVREAFADTPISFLVSKEYASLLSGFRDVSSTIQLDRSRFRTAHPVALLAETFSLLRQLRRAGPHLAVDLQGYGETAFLTWASGAPERWGTVYRPGRKWAYTRAVPRNSSLHPAEDYLALVRGSGALGVPAKNEFVLPKEPLAAAAEFLSTIGLRADRPILFIQAVTSTPEKTWPLDRYLEVARHWRQRGLQVLFGGGPGDRQTLAPVRDAGFPVAAGTPLLVSAGLAALSALVLGGDTGLLHLAVAMNKRVAMLMRSLLPGSTHPFQHKDWAIGAPTEGLIASISTAMVNEHCARACAELGIVS